MNVNNNIHITPTTVVPSTTTVDSLRSRVSAKLKNLVSILKNARSSSQENVSHSGSIIPSTQPQAKRIQTHRFRCSLPFSKSAQTESSSKREKLSEAKSLFQRKLSRVGQGFHLVNQIIRCGASAIGSYFAAFVRRNNLIKADNLKGRGAAQLFNIGMLFMQFKFEGKVSAGCKNIIKDAQIGKNNPYTEAYAKKAKLPVKNSTEENPLGRKKMIKDGCCVSMVAVTLSRYHHQNVQDSRLRNSVAAILKDMEAEKGVHPRAAALQSVYENFNMELYPDGPGSEQNTANHYLASILKQELGIAFNSQKIEEKILSKGGLVNVARAKILDALAVHSLINNHPYISPVDRHALFQMLSQNDTFDPSFSMLNPQTELAKDSLFFERFSPRMQELKQAKTPEEAQKLFQERTEGLDSMEIDQCQRLFTLLIDCQSFLTYEGRNRGEPGANALAHNPRLEAQLELKLTQMTSLFEDKSLFALEGLELRKVPKMTDVAFRRSDQEFYSQIKDINPGTYALTIETNFFGNDAAHAISLIKNGNGSYTIFDPNFGSIECKNYDDCRKQLQKLVKTYPEPKKSFPGSTGPNHMISILKVVPAASTPSPALAAR